MSQQLGKVTRDLDGPRGPDVMHEIEIEAGWFGRTVQVTLPRNLRCAECEGGGCDRCDRAGAVSLRSRSSEPTIVPVVLPALPESGSDLCLRIPEQGGTSDNPAEGRGHLLLRVRLAEKSNAEVSLAPAFPSTLSIERQQLMKRSLLMACGLIAVFLLLLRLSGWL